MYNFIYLLSTLGEKYIWFERKKTPLNDEERGHKYPKHTKEKKIPFLLLSLFRVTREDCWV